MEKITSKVENDELDNALFQKVFSDETKIFDLQKEQFNNIRTLITASAAIASVDLLALSALRDIGLENWFLGSVVLLYSASIIFVLFLTLAGNAQTKMFVERSAMPKMMDEIVKSTEFHLMPDAKLFLKVTNETMKTVTLSLATLKKASRMLAVGNVLFVVGLFVPIFGFIKSLFN